SSFVVDADPESPPSGGDPPRIRFLNQVRERGWVGGCRVVGARHKFWRLLRDLGGVSEGALNKEFKKLLAAVGAQNGATLYTLRSSVTTGMHRANLPPLEMRYLTGHSVNDILNDYPSLDPVGAMRRYFDTIRPLLAALADRARALGLDRP